MARAAGIHRAKQVMGRTAKQIARRSAAWRVDRAGLSELIVQDL